MPLRPLSVAGKTVLAITGFIWGLCRSLETSSRSAVNIDMAGTSALCDLDARLKRIEATVAWLASSERTSETVDVRQASGSLDVTREEWMELLKQTEKRMESHVADQFGIQSLAIGSLRAMIADTDSLLERVLSRLESASGDAGAAFRESPGETRISTSVS